MSKLKFIRVAGLVMVALLLVMVGTVIAGELATFDNPTLAACSLNGISVRGTLTIGDTVYVEEYLNGDLNNRFTGRGGRYSGYVARFNAPDYPYDFATKLIFKDGGGDIIEQYIIEGDCTAEDTGSVEFRELELDAPVFDDSAATFAEPVIVDELAGNLATFDNPTLAACDVGSLSVRGTLTINATVYVEEYLNGNLRNRFTGKAGRYSGYVARFNAPGYPYDFATKLIFKDSGGDIIEQYVIEGDCTAEDTGSVAFRELAVDVPATSSTPDVTMDMAGELATFDNPTLAACSLNGLSIRGTLTIGDTVYVEEYLNGNLRNRFTGQAGRYSGYVARFSASSYPYDFATVLSFKDSGGDIIEQYIIEGDCTAEDTGSVEFREVELDAPAPAWQGIS